MQKLVLNFPTFGFVVATRAMIGAGLGLLLSDRLKTDRRRKVGATLLAVGAATTVPALFAIFRGRREAERLQASRSAGV